MNRRLATFVALVAVSAGLVACGGSGSSGDKAGEKPKPLSKGPVSLTFWSWSPFTKPAVDAFQKAHPNVKVKIVNVGNGPAEYAKLRATLAAGRGAPDVVMLGVNYVSSFVAKKALVDLKQYGADGVIDNFAPWYVSLMKQGDDGLYALPVDTGVMAMIYRADMLKRAGLTAPRTWDEFREAATRLHAAEPGSYLVNFPPEFEYFMSFAWQAGARPFKVDGTKVAIHLDDPAALKVANFWDALIKQGVVKVAPFYTNSWYASVDRGTYASWLIAAWGPVLINSTSSTVGKWRVAPLPQWDAGDNAQPLYGGSTYAVTAQSKHPAEAAELVKFATTTPELVKGIVAAGKYVFVPFKPLYEDPAWQDEKYPFYGPQRPNRVFAEAAKHVDGGFQWGPFADYVRTQGDKYMGAALQDGGSIANVLHKLQADVVDYARRQGYTVE